MKIGRLVLPCLLCTIVACYSSRQAAENIPKEQPYQIEGRQVIYDYISYLNAKDWINASNQMYLSHCQADSSSFFVEFFQSMYENRLQLSLEVEEVQFSKKPVEKEGVLFLLVQYTYDMTVVMDSSFYTHQSMKDGYAEYCQQTFGEERVNYDPVEGKVFADNVVRDLLLINDPTSNCQGWKLVEYGEAGKRVIKEDFGIQF